VRDEFFLIGEEVKAALKTLFQPDKMNYAALSNTPCVSVCETVVKKDNYNNLHIEIKFVTSLPRYLGENAKISQNRAVLCKAAK